MELVPDELSEPEGELDSIDDEAELVPDDETELLSDELACELGMLGGGLDGVDGNEDRDGIELGGENHVTLDGAR